MVKEIADKVTVTGADDSIHPRELVEIFAGYPYVEFGILMSNNDQGGRRFPSLIWLNELYKINRKLERKLPLSAHLCGSWVGDICLGGDAFFRKHADLVDMFQRVQLNFHGQKQIVHQHQFPANIFRFCSSEKLQFIFQMDGVNDELFNLATKYFEANVVPLFDLSSGAGILPEKWPKAVGNYCGYSGGLSPANLPEQMEKIVEAVGEGMIWIDAETLLRSDHDFRFDLDKVRVFLETAKTWVKGC